MSAFPRLESEQLILRELDRHDAQAVLRIFGNEKVVRYYNVPLMHTLDEAVSLIESRRRKLDSGMGIRWAIELKGCPGEYVGSCGFELWHRPWRYAEIGYELAPEHWGRGIMPQALRVMIRYGIESMHLHRVEAQVSPENIASQRVLAKVGFKREGFLRERGFWNLAHHDLLLFALLASELI